MRGTILCVTRLMALTGIALKTRWPVAFKRRVRSARLLPTPVGCSFPGTALTGPRIAEKRVTYEHRMPHPLIMCLRRAIAEHIVLGYEMAFTGAQVCGAFFFF